MELVTLAAMRKNTSLQKGKSSNRKKAKALGKKKQVLDITIKQEPKVSSDILIGDGEWFKGDVVHVERKINDNLPILQDPKDPEKSVLLQEEGPIDEIKCANWGSFRYLSKRQKQKITDKVRCWLRLNEFNRAEYTKKLNEMLQVTYPIDEGPDRGYSVFTKKALKRFVGCLPLRWSFANLRKRSEKNHSSKRVFKNFGVLVWHTLC